MTLLKPYNSLLPLEFNDLLKIDWLIAWLDREFRQSLPAVNIKENKKEFNIEFASPDYNKKDFKIDLDEDVLTISTEK